MAEKEDIPWNEIDKNMIDLVRELNSFEGIKTFSCCGGHSNPGQGQCLKGHFYLSFKVNQTKEGWLALEFLTWFINGQNGLNSYYKNKVSVQLGTRKKEKQVTKSQKKGEERQ